MFKSRFPLLQSPMAGVQDHRLAVAVAKAGGIGALPCAMWDVKKIQSEVGSFRAQCSGELNLNFFCHELPAMPDFSGWMAVLQKYFLEYGVLPGVDHSGLRRPFDDSTLALVLELRPEIVSFHFGLPSAAAMEALRREGILILSSATNLREALDLERRGVDAVILQGIEAGGHRGMYLESELSSQLSTFELLQSCVGRIQVPMILAGGIANADDVRRAFSGGAVAVQVGTAFLLAEESLLTQSHRQALREGSETFLTNVMTGRYARGLKNRLMDEVGLVRKDVPGFPYAASALVALKNVAQSKGENAFTSMWAGVKVNELQEGRAEEVLRRLFP